jgi:hypothetical protein
MSRKRGRTAHQYAQERARRIQARLDPAPVTVLYRCPVCGGEHDRLSHDAPGCFGLTDTELRTLRESAIDELLNALRHDADVEHVQGVLAVIDVAERRLGLRA